MALLWLAWILAAMGLVVVVMAVRFRQGRAEHLRSQPYRISWWPAAQRNFPYSLLPIAGILFLTSASMVAQLAGLRGPVISAAYLLLMLALLVLLVVFMVKRPRWLDPHRPERSDSSRPAPAEAAPDRNPADLPPRPISEMTGKELADWAQGDPEKLRRLLRQRRTGIQHSRRRNENS